MKGWTFTPRGAYSGSLPGGSVPLSTLSSSLRESPTLAKRPLSHAGPFPLCRLLWAGEWLSVSGTYSPPAPATTDSR